MKSVNLSHALFALLMLGCALRPWFLPKTMDFVTQDASVEQNWAFDRWNLARKDLFQLPLTAVEQRFASGFPGAIGRFSDGKTVWVVRHISRATRMLHSAIDCYRGIGYQVSTPHVVQQANNQRWRCFIAERGQKLQVCERIFDDKQAEWTDVSAWYWEILFQAEKHEWWAVTQVTRTDFDAV